MKDKKQIREPLPGFLEKISRENPFITPYNYFDDLPDAIMQRIRSETGKDRRLVWQYYIDSIMTRLSTSKPAWALVFVALMAGIFFFQNEKLDSPTVLHEAMTSADIAEYVYDHLDEFDEVDFYTNELMEEDLLVETIESGDIDLLLEGLVDEVDLETLERIF